MHPPIRIALALVLAFISGTAASQSRITSIAREGDGWQLELEGVETPEFQLDGQHAPASQDGDTWRLARGMDARRLAVTDGKRELLAVRLVPETPADAPFNDWTIYHVMLAYFANVDSGNDRAGMRRWVHPNYAGGDLQGVASKVEYLKALGVNAVWLSPLYASETSHGYDVTNYYRVADAVSVPRDREAAMRLFRNTADALRSAGIRVVLDLPLNHGSRGYERQAGDPRGLKPSSTSAQQEAEKTWDSWNAGFRYWNFADAGTRAFLIDVGRFWLTEGKVDGFRLDYVRGVPHDFWAEFYAAMKSTKPDALLFGEAWQDAAAPEPNAEDIATYYAAVPGKGPQFDGLLDFPLQMAMTDVFARGTGKASDLEHWLQRTAALYGDAGHPVYFLDNHDLSRFLAWTGERGRDRLLAALGFMASLSSPIVVYYGTETGISGGRAASGFTDSGRIAMPWRALDQTLIERVSAILHTRAQAPALTSGARLPVMSNDRILVMLKVHPSGDVLIAVNLAEEDRTVALPASSAGSRHDAWTALIGTTTPVAAEDGTLTWTLPPLSTSWATQSRQPDPP
jgi:glycosidase